MGENSCRWSDQQAIAALCQKGRQPIQKMGRRSRHFSKEDIQMVKKYMKRCSMSLLIREMQISEVYLIPVRKVIINKFTNNKFWRGCGENWILLHCWWECKWVQPLWRTVREFLKKWKIELPCDPVILLLGMFSQKTIIRKETHIPMFTEALFTIVKTWKPPKSVHWQRMDREMCYLYTMEYKSGINRTK